MAKTASQDRQVAYKQNFKTNILWGGGAKDHPGKKRDKRNYVPENDNYKLPGERWAESDLNRSDLLK